MRKYGVLIAVVAVLAFAGAAFAACGGMGMGKGMPMGGCGKMMPGMQGGMMSMGGCGGKMMGMERGGCGMMDDGMATNRGACGCPMMGAPCDGGCGNGRCPAMASGDVKVPQIPAEIKAKMTDLQKAGLELRIAMLDEKVDAEKARAIFERILSLRNELARWHFERSLQTPDAAAMSH